MIVKNIENILTAIKIMKENEFIFSVDVDSNFVQERSDGETNFYHFSICNEEPQAIQIMRTSVEGEVRLGIVIIGANEVLLPELEK